jgi:hypothetical protein
MAALIHVFLCYSPRRHAHALHDPLSSPFLIPYGPSRNAHLRNHHNSEKTTRQLFYLMSPAMYCATVHHQSDIL